MKTIVTVFILIISFDAFSQSDWINLGKEIGYDFYYKKGTIIRGSNPSVVVVGVPQKEMKDPSNTVIKYVTVNVTFYESDVGLRCIISNHLYFYNDKGYKKAGLPKRDLPLNYYVLLSKLYDAIR